MLLLVGCREAFSIERYHAMLNFEEELEKFTPSLEVDQVEEAVMNNDLADVADLLEQVVNGNKDKRQGM